MVDFRDAKNKRRAFTLVEIVFTIAIIGILLAIFLPAMSAIKLAAQKAKDQSNLKTIAAAWYEAVIERGWTFGDGDGRDFWALESVNKLAGEGGSNASDIILNDPHVWISPGDKYASKIIKETICWFDPNEGKVVGGTPWGGNMPFDGPNNNLFSGDSGDVLISYCFIAHGPVSNIPLATTPLAFTRGLCIDGTWDEKSGLYGSKGGFVVFCDGHTNWFDDSKPAKFLHWNGQKYTSDIREAVPLNSEITCCSKSEIYKGNNTKLIIYDFGQG